MTQNLWADFAKAMAVLTQKTRPAHGRSFMFLEFPNDSAVVAAVTANQEDFSGRQAEQEMASMRGLISPDCVEKITCEKAIDGSWIVFAKAREQYETAVGKKMQMELLEMQLEDAITRAVQMAC